MAKSNCFMIGILLLASTCIGCRVGPAKRDQDEFRQALLSMQEDQIMENLIRAHNDLPIVHVDYTRATGTITTGDNTGVGAGWNNSTNGTVGFFPSLAKAATDSLSLSFSSSRRQTFTVTAEPVLDKSEVYDAYLAFLKPHPEFGEKLICCSSVPSSAEAHIWKEFRGVYYYVPKYFSKEFLKLSLATTVSEGTPYSHPDLFEVNVKRLDLVDPGQYQLVKATLSSEINNDIGTLYATISGQRYLIPVRLNPDVQPGKKSETILLNLGTIQPSLKDPMGNVLSGKERFGLIKASIEETSVSIKLNSFLPPLPTTDSRLEDLRAELEQIRIN